MVKQTFLNANHHVQDLHDIMEKISSWKFEPVQGIGFYKGLERYAHIEIKIYPSKNEKKSSILWNIKEEQIPENFRTNIQDYLSFFNDYISILKRENISLFYEIHDGSFNIDSRNIDFHKVTSLAVINCFKDNPTNLDEFKRSRINQYKKNGTNLLQYLSLNFPPHEIFNSIKNKDLNSQIKIHFLNKNTEIIQTFLKERDRKSLNEIFINQLSENEINYFIDNKILSKYMDITDIGLAHIGIIHRYVEIFRFFGIYDLSEIYKNYDHLF